MGGISELIDAHPEGEEGERFRFECAGGAATADAAQDRLTPYGGAAAWSHYLEKLGVVADLARRFPVAPTSPNATPVADIVQAPANFRALLLLAQPRQSGRLAALSSP